MVSCQSSSPCVRPRQISQAYLNIEVLERYGVPSQQLVGVFWHIGDPEETSQVSSSGSRRDLPVGSDQLPHFKLASTTAALRSHKAVKQSAKLQHSTTRGRETRNQPMTKQRYNYHRTWHEFSQSSPSSMLTRHQASDIRQGLQNCTPRKRLSDTINK